MSGSNERSRAKGFRAVGGELGQYCGSGLGFGL